MQKILLLAGDTFVSTLITASIRSHPDWFHCHIDAHDSLRQAVKELSVSNYEMILVECPSFENSPLEILIQLRGVSRNTPIIMINRPGFEKTAISCLKNGADYYLVQDKNWEEEIPHVMDSVLEERKQKNILKVRLFHLEQENKRLRQNSILDQETALYSEAHFKSLLSNELHRASRYSLNLACLILDVVATSEINTKTPPAALNMVYEKLGLLLRSIVRSCDMWGRLHHDRFAALLPHTTMKQARHAIKRIEAEISGTQFLVDELPVKITTKWGVAHFDKDTMKNEEDLLRHTETSLTKG